VARTAGGDENRCQANSGAEEADSAATSGQRIFFRSRFGVPVSGLMAGSLSAGSDFAFRQLAQAPLKT